VNSNQRTTEKNNSKLKKNDSYEKYLENNEKIQIKVIENVFISNYVAEFQGKNRKQY
jgi:hypothetical protein